MNRAILSGNVGRDVELRRTAGGRSVANIRLATSYSWRDDAGERKEETEWHDVEVWGKQAEACGQYLAKGSRILVEGRIKTETWTDKQTGEKRSRAKIVADFVEFLDRRPAEATPNGGGAEAAPTA